MTQVRLDDFARNWHLGEGYGDIDLKKLTPTQQKALSKADANNDGTLTLNEARTYLDTVLDTNAKAGDQVITLKPTADAESFGKALQQVFSQRSGRPINAYEHTQIKGEVLYLQFNRPAGGPKATREEGDVRTYVAADRDKPKLNQLNMTAAFNGWADEEVGKTEFKAAMLQHIDQLARDGTAMTGLIFSGHSNGEYMLQEVVNGHEHGYLGKLNIREALWELRNDPDPTVRDKVRRAFDSCEYVVAQACFQGAAAAEWSKVFPNATVVGTSFFAPAQTDGESGQLVRSAIAAATAGEYGGTTADALRAGMQGVNSNLSATRGIVIDTPDDRLGRAKINLARATRDYDASADKMNAFINDFNEIATRRPDADEKALAAELKKKGYNGAQLKALYVTANSFYLATRSLWALENVKDGQPMQVTDDIRNLEGLRNTLFLMRMALGG
jgi:hypothetical protein